MSVIRGAASLNAADASVANEANARKLNDAALDQKITALVDRVGALESSSTSISDKVNYWNWFLRNPSDTAYEFYQHPDFKYLQTMSRANGGYMLAGYLNPIGDEYLWAGYWATVSSTTPDNAPTQVYASYQSAASISHTINGVTVATGTTACKTLATVYGVYSDNSEIVLLPGTHILFRSDGSTPDPMVEFYWHKKPHYYRYSFQTSAIPGGVHGGGVYGDATYPMDVTAHIPLHETYNQTVWTRKKMLFLNYSFGFTAWHGWATAANGDKAFDLRVRLPVWRDYVYNATGAVLSRVELRPIQTV